MELDNEIHSLTAETFKSLFPKEFIQKHIQEGIRPDNRSFLEHRRLALKTNSISQCQGSCTVKIGNSIVVCGIKAEITQPQPIEPRRGFLKINLSLPKVTSKNIANNGKDERAHYLQTVIEQTIIGANVFDLNELCIVAGKKVWVLYTEIMCLQSDGSILDACMAAVMAALINLKLPDIEFSDNQMTILKNESGLTINRAVLSCTFALFEGNLLADPIEDEEIVANTIFSFMIDNEGLNCGFIKPGGDVLSKEKLNQSLDLAVTRAIEIVSKLKE